MNYFSIFIKFIVITSIVCSLLVNFGLCYNEGNFLCLIALRNVFLYLLLYCFIVRNRFTLGLLILLSIFFWSQFFQEISYIAYPSNSVLYFNHNLSRILNLMNCNEFVLKTVMIIPFVLFLMVTFFEIPYRIFTTFNKKKVA
ncbi:hypothetical protein FLJU110815_11085 [Flavobacterium jumunjinense]